MTVAKKIASNQRSCRRVPCTVCISPSFLSSFFAQFRAACHGQLELAHVRAGLLFGSVKEREVTLEGFRNFAVTNSGKSQSPDSELLDRDFEQCIMASQQDRGLAYWFHCEV
jgi:hypothetical protein